MSSKEQVLDQIRHASTGFEALLNNQVSSAREILESRPDSASHLVGLGIVAFLVSILSREEAELKVATETLQRAEAKANVEASARRSKGDSGVYAPGTEFKVLLGDATIGQALIAVMSESYVEFAKAVWKLNKSYKIFMSVHKIVFPDDIGEDESLRQVFTKLNQHYLNQTTQQAAAPAASGSSGLFGWGRSKKNPVLNRVRHSSSSSDLPSLSSSSSPAGIGADGNSVPASEPVSNAPSPNDSTTDLAAGVDRLQVGRTTTAVFMEADEDDFPTPLWANDPLTTLIISGAALGSGLFGLIFSMMPPKMRKLISWFGFSSSSRSASLKLLKVAASTGNDVHGYFASLTLTTFYGFLLLMTGWQASEASYLRTMATVLDRVHARFPNGTLWVLNRAKLARYSRRTGEAIVIIEQALAREEKEGNGFREADSLLLTWLYLSQAKFRQVADAAEKMCLMNSWSHATYVSIAAGALVDEINSIVARGETPDPELIARTEALFDRLPALCTEKRTLGEKPVTETFIVRRLEAQRAKLQRWISAGRLPPDAKLWQAIRITNSMELGLFWATVGGRSPIEGLRAQIDLLSSFTPKPTFVSSDKSISRLSSPSSASLAVSGVDLDTPAEVLLRDLLLGALYTALGHYEPPFLAVAIKCLDSVANAPANDVGEEKWVVPFATWHRAVVELKVGDVETADVQTDAAKARGLWKPRLDRAERLLDSLTTAGEYDLKTRLESRILMLREEIRSKRRKMGIDQ
ncbi:hypothetical protein C6P46_005372 [Rhodotorula mucilaginosa]|uniref:Mitochondrial outer membrane protein IML2 n=1 Tax=Rhodotorula mucilaginosa TaxID=5537 RepID=A0A9P6W0N1_RHOMI|nr:hypothetical protein C6P46_005372 [Rhodotorula mucilaginosa]